MKNFFLILVTFSFFYSCIPHKKIVYFQKNKKVNDDTITILKLKYHVQPNDILSINVTSFNTQVSEFYNLKNAGGVGGYLINEKGYIHIPMLDSVYVKDLTLIQIQELIKNRISEHVVNPYVLVSIANFKFTTMGEFGIKGIIDVKQNELNIIEAVAMAGDISDVGDKAHVKLIRLINGKQNFISLNLNNRDIIKTEYYYIQPNDILYAEPLHIKSFRTNLQQVVTYIGLISLVFVFYQTIQNFNK